METKIELLTTFQVGTEHFAIEVMKIQEVTGMQAITQVPLAPHFVKGLINLRGQLSTALGLRELFHITSAEVLEPMSVVCRVDGNLVSLIVDSIGDVIEADRENFEQVPDSLPESKRQFLKGIYKMDGKLLSVIDLDRLAKALVSAEGTENRI